MNRYVVRGTADLLLQQLGTPGGLRGAHEDILTILFMFIGISYGETNDCTPRAIVCTFVVVRRGYRGGALRLRPQSQGVGR